MSRMFIVNGKMERKMKCDGCGKEVEELSKTWWGEMLCEECIRRLWLQNELSEEHQ